MDIERVKTKLRGLIGKLDRTILLLPRPFRDTEDEKLVELALKTASGVVTGAIMVKTGKALRLDLKNRELNKFGRGSALVGVVVSGALVLVYGHELWARLRNDRIGASFDPFSKEDGDLLDSLKLLFAMGPKRIDLPPRSAR